MNSHKSRRDDDKKTGGRKRISTPKSTGSSSNRNDKFPKKLSTSDFSDKPKRSYTRKDEGTNDKPFNRKPFGENKSFEKRPYEKRTEHNTDRSNSRKPFGNIRDNDDKRPFVRNTDSRTEKPFARKPYGAGNTGNGEKRSYTRRDEGSTEKPFERKSNRDNDTSEKRPYTKRNEGSSEKPFERKSYRDNDSSEKRPYTKRTEGNERVPRSYGKPREQRNESPQGRPQGNDSRGKERSNESFAKRSYVKNTEDTVSRPYERKPFNKTGDRNNEIKRPYTKRTEGNFDSKPAFEREGGNRKPDERREGRDFGKPYKSNSYADNKRKDGAKPYTKREDAFGKKVTNKSKYNTDDNDPDYIRLNRYLSNAGICSRREADDLIASGVITVNGELVTELGAKVHMHNDLVRYNNEPVRRERLQYILMNKPKDFITTTDDPQERKTVTSLVERLTNSRVYPVGRLDRNTTGVLLLTNDGDLTLKLTHPKFGVTKVYAVELDKKLRQEDYIKIKEGLTLEDGDIKVDDVAYIEGMDKNNVGVQLHSGRNRIVRRIFESLGYRVVKLDRTSFASLSKKGLKRGECRFLTPAEVGRLKNLKS